MTTRGRRGRSGAARHGKSIPPLQPKGGASTKAKADPEVGRCGGRGREGGGEQKDRN
jgi:hypothetical protein